jgi:predicted 2-oxoglutarate/Fe(II)-dependent dioxygenase YbiX
MTTAARDRLAKLLGGQARTAAPSMEVTAPPNDIRVDVAGIGRLQYPVTAGPAKKLIRLGAPASFGKGAETITDPQVRDTWEIPKDLVRVEWDEAALESVLGDVREGLGLPWHCGLEIDFHSMLVYEKGQFFVAHQDTEKDDAMIGTLVVTLPSAYTGGTLLIGRDEEWTAHNGSKTAHTLVAFYADLRHEVLPVKTGYRITVTYNLLLRGDTSVRDTGDDATVAELANCLTEHFTTRAARYYGGQAEDPPNRLAYLLDHEYTPRGLSWSRLKGADASRCDLLCTAAEKADCEVVLALADVKETHSAYDADEYHERGRYGRYENWDDEDEDEDWDDEDEGDGGSGEYVIEDLVDSEVAITRWLDPAGKRAEDVSLHVGSHEVCASTPSGALKPYESSYEGYMGNWGNTLDRWYKRGAVLIWPRAQAFANRAETSPAWAMDELDARARSGDLEGARTAAGTLGSFWEQAARRAESALLPKALRSANTLDHAGIAMTLLRPFHLETLRAEHAAALGGLAVRYGQQWATELLGTWSGDSKSWDYARGRQDWTLALPELCQALLVTGPDEAMLARQLFGLTWEWLRGRITGELAAPSPRQRRMALDGLGAALTAILTIAAQAGMTAEVEEVTDFARLQSHEVIPLLLAALRAASTLPGDVRRDGGFGDLAKGCAARLQVLLGRPPRAAGDWSIQLPAGCACELCATLKTFLANPARRTYEWRLRKESRHHIHSRIDAAELPVTHVTRRTGSPYTLVLTKTEALFSTDRDTRARDAASLDWLSATWSTAR